MRIIIRTLLLVIVIGMTSEITLHLKDTRSRAHAAQPEYAKWGELAMAQTKAKYKADIVDYLHVGRRQVSQGIAEETFKLWLRDNKHEYGVRVMIQFYTKNDQIISIKFQETTNGIGRQTQDFR